MREIKFRGKSLKTGKWFYGNLYDQDTHGRTHICTIHGGCLCIDTETIGQYTGLKDRNSKEIYEGDVVLLGDNCKIPYVVEWQEEIAMFIVSTQGFVNCGCVGIYDTNDFRQVSAFGGCRIIGNIHDNPELVKGGEK